MVKCMIITSMDWSLTAMIHIGQIGQIHSGKVLITAQVAWLDSTNLNHPTTSNGHWTSGLINLSNCFIVQEPTLQKTPKLCIQFVCAELKQNHLLIIKEKVWLWDYDWQIQYCFHYGFTMVLLFIFNDQQIPPSAGCVRRGPVITRDVSTAAETSRSPGEWR